jgi:3-oxoacyl-[acyl-carrier protein] reductase
MNTGLDGKTALVLGAGGGLGSAIARALAEYGAAVAFLASELASCITGSTLRVDGGLIPAI